MRAFFLYPRSPFIEMLRNLMPNDPVVKQFLDLQTVLTPTQWGYYIVTILASFVPMIIGSAALWLLYWRALLRTRELHADARVAQWQGGDPGPLWEMLWIENLSRTGQRAAVRVGLCRDYGVTFAVSLSVSRNAARSGLENRGHRRAFYAPSYLSLCLADT